MISSENNGIQMLKKFNSLQILVSAVFIGDPLTVFLTVIQVEHGCNRIYTKTINVAFLYPVKSVCDQDAHPVSDLHAHIQQFRQS